MMDHDSSKEAMRTGARKGARKLAAQKRQTRRVEIREALRARDLMTVPELATATGRSRGVVRAALAELIEKGWVVRSGRYRYAVREKLECRGVTVEAIRPFIEWLDSEQKPDAWVSQFGVGKDVGDFYVYIAPHGPAPNFAHNRAPGGSVLVFSVREGAKEYRRRSKGVGHELLNGIPRGQRDALEEIVEQIVPVHEAWNGESQRVETCSFHVAKDPGPDVARAYKNYSGLKPQEGPRVTDLDGEEG